MIRLLTAAAVGPVTGCGNDDTRPEPPVDTVVAVPSTIDGIPADVPSAVVPNDADVSGIIGRIGEQGSSAAEFSITGEIDRDQLSADAQTAAEGDGWTFIERTYDEVTMVMTFTRDGATLTWSLTLTDDGADGAVIVVGAD